MADRRCKRIFALLSDYLDGVLPAGDRRELERHMEGCKPCIAFLDSLKTTVAACRRYGENEMRRRPQLPPEMRTRLMGLVASPRPESTRAKVRARRK